MLNVTSFNIPFALLSIKEVVIETPPRPFNSKLSDPVAESVV